MYQVENFRSVPITQSFRVEANLPIPPISGRGRRAGSMFPFSEMSHGDSFLIPTEGKTAGQINILRAGVAQAFRRFRKTSQTKNTYVSRLLPEGLRVWVIR